MEKKIKNKSAPSGPPQSDYQADASIDKMLKGTVSSAPPKTSKYNKPTQSLVAECKEEGEVKQ